MLQMPTQLARFQQMSVLSSRMVDAARCGDWDELVDLERRVADLRDDLAALGTTGAGAASEPVETERARELIQQILDDDAEIRRHTEPWMEQVRLLLSGHLAGWRIYPGAGDNSASGPGSGR